MEVALGAQDAMEWSYRGEGAANLVLFYCGRSPQFVGKVLRIQKDRANGSENRTGHSSLTIPERHLWKDVKELVCILVSKEFLEAVEKNALQVRPPWRIDAAKVNLLSDSAILMSDHSTFPHGYNYLAFFRFPWTQPKCGFLPQSEFIKGSNAVKRRISRFKMHQALKVDQGKISYISGYDPLDMFSESKDRLDKAMMDLFMTPQNNFRVFLNGSLKFGGLGGVAEATNAKDSQEFEDGLFNSYYCKGFGYYDKLQTSKRWE
ncbi:unnamed protein product [Cuscuta campestris]|uniref:Inositol-pentakisphosphate 2-kinase n=1 Tax=Cuscuta campestris TaxID=132261 RepID=A0A484LSV9_9ASTE|nr:unnamed protein product [Cuscuta campestris]